MVFSKEEHSGIMFSFQKWKCSRSLVASVASILALVSVVHLFLFPVVPSFDYLLAKHAQNACIPLDESINGSKGNVLQSSQPVINLDVQFPADLHKAVVYHNAPWKADIGRWLSGCNPITTAVKVVEVVEVDVGARAAKMTVVVKAFAIVNWVYVDAFMDSAKSYSNLFVMANIAVCMVIIVNLGIVYSLSLLLTNNMMWFIMRREGCSERLHLECNFPGSEDLPYGHWVVSICPAYCDTTRAMCFCGEGTKYPNRPVAEACGFKINLPSKPEGPKLTDWTKNDLDNVMTTNGSKPGWCNVDPADAYASKIQFKKECDCKYDGLWGRFCEVPVLCTCINQCSGHGHCRGGFCQCENGWYGIDCSIPSVLPSIREWPQWLQPAQINIPNTTKHVGSLVGLTAMVEKKRPLVYVYDMPPEFGSLLLEGRHFKFECVNRIYDEKNATLWTDQLYGSQMAFYESILASHHRTLNGKEADFFFVPVLDSCIITRADDAPHLSMEKHTGLRSSLTLEFYKKAHDHIVEQYPFWNRSSGRDHIWSFSWDEGACYAPKEIWNSMMSREKRNTLFYFNGNLGPAYEHGRPEDTYSMGIRQKVAEEFGSTPNKEGKLGKQHAEDVIVTPLRSDNYHKALANSVFCGVMPGDGWSGRMEDSMLQGCIPVVIQDGIYLPYENVLNYESFAVRIGEDEIPELIKILRGFNETEIEFRLANVQKIWQRFLYRDSFLLEAERQKAAFGQVDDWAVEFLQLGEDDVIATVIQVLHYKLHNDPWRRQLARTNKEFGLPQECMMKN
ncbi:hypothetical protein RHGRI_010480 [Rhododendron griersonianum]|uniref:Exostosin GT47 domain-containing protein n=1 Tax=Rhododendron griersonianum TaxID=479676 RepID=A0AAV6KIP2_9ERIC|nr:hypothetical protein RHGRI_010480 [Rhododendron griersonianum]